MYVLLLKPTVVVISSICTYSQSKYCVRNVKGCFENYPHPSYTISLHETAQDYNYVSQLILRAHGGEVFLYGSSYGSILAYRAFKFNPKLVGSREDGVKNAQHF